MVAPVPFDYVKFRFVEEIEQFLKKNKLPKPHEYQLFVNGEDIRKGYEDPLKIEDGKSVDILGVECHTIKADNKIIGWYWFCISRFEGVLPKKCWQRCIRLRKANIQIGEADCLSNHPRRGVSLWKEDRGNNYFIGEIHALDEDLIPNSRRDYFNQDDACRRFETALTEAFKNLDKLYHDASKLRSETSKIQKANQARKDFEAKEKAGEFLNPQEREEAQTEVEKLEANSKAAQKRIEKIYDKAKGGAIEKVADEYMPDVLDTFDKVEDKPFAPKEQPQKGYAEDNIQKDTMSVLKTVFNVLDNVLPPDQSELVREAIIRRFVKK
jgi:molecular chaperone HtpG